jgi:uncharacterized cupredoxin-like copper-binding protein|tara:strand:- start:7337 stop:7489 length:153 start_codon:yes stop_codon:yes gene_type:complete
VDEENNAMKFWITIRVAGITLPFQAHSEGDLTCPVAGHQEAGMTGSIRIY